MTDEDVVRMVARGMYVVYCERNNLTQFRRGYVPAWALDYAEVAVRMLGYPDDVTREELESLMVTASDGAA